ncbi:type 1 glutamine amidotransferase domain-containing protein (plasmid) [Streptomyces sp. NBC_01340]|uniref:type 1 glutamine amidotransferase domain-containing protein n=1 Tax=unclassified Streptomyces TaxID=2593676 RepID=UPI00224E730D|nr:MULTISPECIES: type 1 glutamine amidotransferase domain-containing protein [unclassified Streptomyces]MCX4461679.1 type 1 glutamine amidotransferase domain-containing protein [Streptomyces sp. NBC_01719]MCX4490588.1 type 1 glutamine amidotransferase domain-containing protein [Streptomyces sp. NBC_01728]WSI45653.1 type 1 glutamine amidotransferase domain-containing protein [Streptomyces sp. NBC_01340]
MAKILFVITASDHWTLADGTRQPAGFWAEEALGPYQVFKEAGYEIAAATPGGVSPTADALSLTPDFNGGEEGAERMRTALREATELAQPLCIEDVRVDDYAAVFYPGGWGPMEDLPDNAESGKLLTEWLASGKPVSLVCHGPAALLATIGPDGTSPFTGYRLTGLSNAEEKQNGLADRAKWLLQDRLVNDLGADYREADPFTPHVEVDRTLFTGQNPGSATPLAREVLKALS